LFQLRVETGAVDIDVPGAFPGAAKPDRHKLTTGQTGDGGGVHILVQSDGDKITFEIRRRLRYLAENGPVHNKLGLAIFRFQPVGDSEDNNSRKGQQRLSITRGNKIDFHDTPRENNNSAPGAGASSDSQPVS